MYVGKKIMLNQNTNEHHPQTHLGLRLGMMAACAGAALLKLDQHAGRRQSAQYSEETNVINYPADSDTALVVFPGLSMNAQTIADTFSPLVAGMHSVIVPSYPDKSFNQAAVFEQTHQEILKTNAKNIHLIGFSMGGILAADFMQYGHENGWADTISRIGSVAMCGSPSGNDDIRPLPKLLLEHASLVEQSWSVGRARPFFMNERFKSLAKAPLTAIAAQCRYIAGPHAEQIAQPPKNLLWVRGAMDDPVIHETAAIASFTKRFGAPIKVVTNPHHERAVHAPTDNASASFILSQLGLLKPATILQAA